MSTLISILIGLAAAIVAVGIVAGVVYYVTTRPPAPPPPPAPRPPIPPVPGNETVNLYFSNTLLKPIYVIPVYGTATDSHHWTSWPVVPGQANPEVVEVPRTASLVYKKLMPGETWQYSVLTAGMAATSFFIRVDCDDTTMICEMGDSGYVYILDGPTPNDLYRDKTSAGPVPFKPNVDTKIEISWGCRYSDASLCGVNPSCITDPTTSGCVDLPPLMAANPTARFSTNGLLYKPDGSGGLTNIPLTGTHSGALGSSAFFDVSCVDGFTVPVVLQVKRPNMGLGSSTCTVQAGVAVDSAVSGWQTVADTRHLADLSQCPTNEVLWPSQRTVAVVPPSTTGDGYNDHAGTVQFDMPWVTKSSLSTAKLLAAFAPGTSSEVDLTQYRNPLDIAAVPSKGWTINDIIGCSSPCSVLTQNRAVSQMYPKTGGKYTTSPYLAFGETPFASTDRGVSEVCCKPPPDATVVKDSNIQCNTSTWWTQPPGMGPAAPTVVNVNYNYGFYVNMYAPVSGQPWWNGSGSINPYASGPQQVKYVNLIRDNMSGQDQTTRAYAYAHDDSWSELVCASTAQLNPSDGRGTYYSNYDIRVTIGLTLLP